MTTTDTATRPARNGVDVPTPFATLAAVKGQPEIAAFQFRASNRWVSGTHSRRPRDQPARGHLDRGGRHRPQRDPRPVEGGAERLLGHPRALRRPGGRSGRAAAGTGRAVPAPLGRLRRAHQRPAGARRRHHLLIPRHRTRPRPRKDTVMNAVDTVVIGAGHAGLAMSAHLAARGRDHVVLDRGRTAERWRSERWDSLRLLTPNWMTRLPGYDYRDPDPDGYMTAAELAGLLNRYAAALRLPVMENTAVRVVEAADAGYRIVTDGDTWSAANVVIATGACDAPAVPAIAAGLHPAFTQIPTSAYRNPAQLPPGGVLVVGASASGLQIADELRSAGREVVLATGSHTRLPR